MTIQEEKTLHEEKLQKVAAQASAQARKRAFKKGIAVVVLEGKDIVKISPSGEKRRISIVDTKPIKATNLPTSL